MSAFYITGIPGTGKSTIITTLKNRGIAAIDLDYLPNTCVWRNRQTLAIDRRPKNPSSEWLEQHEWIADVRQVNNMIGQHTNQPIYLCGMVGNTNELWSLFKAVFLLRADINAILARLQTRTNSDDFGATATERRSILTWYQQFEQEMAAKGAIVVDANQPLEQIVLQIVSQSNSADI